MTLSDALKRVDADEAQMSVQDEILAVTEDFAHYIASRTMGITVATPARRKLREDIERVVLSFAKAEVGPTALEHRVDARLDEIQRQQTVLLETIRQATPTMVSIKKLDPAQVEELKKSMQQGSTGWLENTLETASKGADPRPHGSEEDKRVATGDNPD